MYVASSKVSSSEVEKHLCRVCSKPFLTISSRNKHERVNRKCSEVSIVEVGAADHGRDEGEGVSVEFSVNNIRQQCNFCHHKFTTVFCAKQHLCLLSPSFGPEYTVLHLVEEDVAGEFKALHQFNSSYQNLRTCQITNQAMPGVFPLIFTGPKVAGRSASCLLARLRGLGNVGNQAYATLHEALKEVPELRLPLCFTIYLPGGEVVSLGKDLTVPTNKKELRDLLVRVEGGEIIVARGGVVGQEDTEEAVNNGGFSGQSECQGGVWREQMWRDLVGEGEGSLSDGEGSPCGGGGGSPGGGGFPENQESTLGTSFCEVLVTLSHSHPHLCDEAMALSLLHLEQNVAEQKMNKVTEQKMDKMREQKMDKMGEGEELNRTSREAFQSACSMVIMAVLQCHPSCCSSASR